MTTAATKVLSMRAYGAVTPAAADEDGVELPAAAAIDDRQKRECDGGNRNVTAETGEKNQKKYGDNRSWFAIFLYICGVQRACGQHAGRTTNR